MVDQHYSKRLLCLLNIPLNFYAGGVGSSALQRANMLAQHGVESHLFVNVVERQFGVQKELFESHGRIGDGVSIHDVLGDLRAIKRKFPDSAPKSDRFLSFLECDRQEDRRHPGFAYYVADGKRIAREFSGSITGMLLFTLYGEGGSRESVLVCTPDREPVCVDYYNSEDKVVLTEYFDSEGYAFLEHEGGEWRYYDADLVEHHFKSEDELALYWIEQFYADLFQDANCISEWGYRGTILRGIKERYGTNLMIQFHNNHLSNEFSRRYGPVQPAILRTLELAKEIGAGIIVLTNEQRMDLLKYDPFMEGVVVIPHVAREVPEDSRVYRNPLKIVSVSRLADSKKIHEVIPHFKRVVDRVPNVVWEIYGHGPMANEVRQAISENRLEKNVIYKGFTSSPLDVYRGAAVSLFPSFFEGQPLALMESVACGCVPVGTDFKYGIRYAVEDGVSGFIVDPGNYDELLDAASLLLVRPDLREEFAENGKKRLRAVNNQTATVEKWLALLS